MKVLFGFIVTFIFLKVAVAQKFPSSIETGFLMQKSVGMYTDAGLYAGFFPSDSLPMSIGVEYLSTRFGSAISSNALKQDSFLANCSYFFRNKKTIRPFAGVNFGFTHVDFGSELFNELPNKALLLSPEGGVKVLFLSNFQSSASAGFNLLTSDGTGGVGSVMLLFCQFSVGYIFHQD